jgi:carboxyl-terminal processing protease
MKKRIIVIVSAVVISIGLMSFADGYFEISKNLDVFAALYKDVNTYYVDEVEPSKLMRSCIDGMLKTLDPFTNYFSGSQIEGAKIQQGGKFGGIGVEIEVMNGNPVITSVTQSQPADKSGLNVGDIIKTIDGQSTKDRKKDEVEKYLVGQPGSSVDLTVERKNMTESKQLSFNIKREEIQETSVPFYGMITPEIGCIKLKIFNEGAGKDVKNAFDSLKSVNPNMKGLVLDLRGNPGGFLK